MKEERANISTQEDGWFLGKRVEKVDVILGEMINKSSLEEFCQLLFPFLAL